jgi:hypothetical protein
MISNRSIFMVGFNSRDDRKNEKICAIGGRCVVDQSRKITMMLKVLLLNIFLFEKFLNQGEVVLKGKNFCTCVHISKIIQSHSRSQQHIILQF